MTEPVAYLVFDNDSKREFLRFTPSPFNDNVPLYTKEQIHPRVKMTRAEFDEFQMLRLNDFIAPYDAMCCISVDSTVYKNLYRRIFTNHDDALLFHQVEFSKLWSGFDARHPKETIEIVPDMKWFVRSKEQYKPDMDQGIAESGYLYLTQGDIYSIEYYETTTFKDEAQQFDTKEEAEKWTNPLTEAVQLPVEGE